jgi:hypothetical protein
MEQEDEAVFTYPEALGSVLIPTGPMRGRTSQSSISGMRSPEQYEQKRDPPQLPHSCAARESLQRSP